MRRDICTHMCCCVTTDADTQWKEKIEIDRETTPPRHTTHHTPLLTQKTHTTHKTQHNTHNTHTHTTHTQRTHNAHNTHTTPTAKTHHQKPRTSVVVFLMTLDKLPIALISLASFCPVSFRWKGMGPPRQCQVTENSFFDSGATSMEGGRRAQLRQSFDRDVVTRNNITVHPYLSTLE